MLPAELAPLPIGLPELHGQVIAEGHSVHPRDGCHDSFVHSAWNRVTRSLVPAHDQSIGFRWLLARSPRPPPAQTSACESVR